jgi:RHS repeat-associated protein
VASIASSNANGASVGYTYDTLNRLSTVVDNRLTGNNTTTYAYDPASNVTTATLPNGVQSAMTYDTLNRISGLAASSSSAEVSGYTYQRGPTGTLSSATELNGRTLTWNYDGIYRLTNETIASDPTNENGSISYGLDPVGNRLSDTSSLSGINSTTGAYNADDELSTETYDANGNTLTTGGKTFTYDAENHLTGMTAGGTTVSIIYDAFGNRVAKTVNGVTTKYLVEDDVNPTGYPQVTDELTGGAVTRTYTYGLQRISQNQIISSTWTPSFYGYDGTGSVRQLTNSVGAVTDTYEYDAFGNEVNHTGTTPNNYLYRGEQYDQDLGLYYLRARYYNPLTGRFVNRDPSNGIITDPKTLHKYVYANGDPVNLKDPTGRDAEVADGLLIGEIAIPTEVAEAALAVAVACVLNTAADILGIAAEGEIPIPEPAKCTATCKKVPDCDPPVGTTCMQMDTGHEHNGWDPHYHLWKRGYKGCHCRWDKIGGRWGGYEFPIPDVPMCSSFGSFPNG